EAATYLFVPKAGEKGIELSVSIDLAAQRGFHGDPAKLRQILLNLVGNAVKFTDHGSVSVTVSSRSTDDANPVLRFEVADTGIGVAPDTGDRLFDKFNQGDTSITRRFGGSGLGLAICKQLVELMDGKIGVDRLIPCGSRFWFEISLPGALNVMIAPT